MRRTNSNDEEAPLRKRARPTIDFEAERGVVGFVGSFIDGHLEPTVAMLKEDTHTFENSKKPAYLVVVGALFACVDENEAVEILKWFAEVCPDHLASTQKVVFERAGSDCEGTPATFLLSRAAFASFDYAGDKATIVETEENKVLYTNKSLEFALEHGVPLQDVADTVVGAMVDWTEACGDVDTTKAVLRALRGSREEVAEGVPVFGTLRKWAAPDVVATTLARCVEVMQEHVDELYPPGA